MGGDDRRGNWRNGIGEEMKVRVQAVECYPFYDAIGGRIVGTPNCPEREILDMSEKEYTEYLDVMAAFTKWQTILDERYQKQFE